MPNPHDENFSRFENVHIGLLEDILTQLQTLNERLTTNMATIDEVLAAVSAIEGDTANVERVLGELNSQITALQAQVADLQAQIAAGNAVTPEQLQAIDDRLTAADASLDSLAPDQPTP